MQVIKPGSSSRQRSSGKGSSGGSWWPWGKKQTPAPQQRRSTYRDDGSSDYSRLDELWGQWQEEEEARRQGFEDYW
jgi:hypothetical protein